MSSSAPAIAPDTRTFISAFEVLLSTPMIRHTDEFVLAGLFDDYTPLAQDANPPSSLWLRRVY